MQIPLKFFRQFGSRYSGKEDEALRRSPNFRNGRFENVHHTPQLTEGASFMGVLFKFIFGKVRDKRPKGPMPSVKTDLSHLQYDESVVWFGHSSYLLRTGGRIFLVDPVFSGSAAPVPGMTKAFEGTDVYLPEELPTIDYLVITHDHYDHLDYDTVVRLKDKVGLVVCGLGVGAHFRSWGYEQSKIIEMDWHQQINLADGIILHSAPARHFSGRLLKRNTTLWMSFIVESSQSRIYIGGDSGYDSHFKEIGARFGSFDLVILECGQYNENWKYIHMQPEETVQAAYDLNAKKLLPVHHSKFALAQHPWYEPVERLSKIRLKGNLELMTLVIGEERQVKE